MLTGQPRFDRATNRLLWNNEPITIGTARNAVFNSAHACERALAPYGLSLTKTGELASRRRVEIVKKRR